MNMLISVNAHFFAKYLNVFSSSESYWKKNTKYTQPILNNLHTYFS